MDEKDVTPESVAQAIKILRKQMPSFEIVFEIKIRQQDSSPPL